MAQDSLWNSSNAVKLFHCYMLSICCSLTAYGIHIYADEHFMVYTDNGSLSLFNLMLDPFYSQRPPVDSNKPYIH